MVADVVSYDDFVEFTVLGKLHVHFLIEVFKMLNGRDEVLLRYVASVCKRDRRIRVLVHVTKYHRLGEGWLIVEARAGVTVAASTNLEIEGAIYSKEKNMVR